MKTAINLVAIGWFLVAVASSSATVHYVDVNSANPIPPYTNWATAALIIQDSVDAAAAGDEIVVSNGVYATGGTFDVRASRVTVDKPLSLRSINGPQFTAIDGGFSVRCVYLANGATLSGFTLTNGLFSPGAGLWCESTNAIAYNCIISGNRTSMGGVRTSPRSLAVERMEER